MSYTRQQMCGHKDYSHRTFTGNWQEDVAREGEKLRDYILNERSGSLETQKLRKKTGHCLVPVTLTPQPADGNLRFGDLIMLQSGHSKGALALDTNTECEGRQGHYVVTVSKSCTPIARTAWTVLKAKDPNTAFYKKVKERDVVHYGQQVRIVNQCLGEANLVLSAEMNRPDKCLRGNTTGQERGEVSACVGGSFETFWHFLPAEVSWTTETEGHPVKMGDVVVLKSVKVNQYLSTEPMLHSSMFGPEEEVSTFFHKETQTKGVVQAVGPRNMWGVLCAPEGAPFTPFAAGKKKEAIDRVRHRIVQRSGSLGFRGLVRSLRIMDDDGNRKLSRRELKDGMATYGVPLSPGELDAVFEEFDRDGDGVITITEFLRTIRGPMNDRRAELVLVAYGRLDRDGSGVVTFRDLKEIYGANLPRHPEVLNGSKTEKEVLMEFSACWDKDGDGTVTLEEFKEYYNDISVNIDSDDYFELMLRNAWHISGGEGVCENTSCRRVLVIHTDGSQTVEEIKDDLGIGPDDIPAMKANLRAQGITDIKDVRLTY